MKGTEKILLDQLLSDERLTDSRWVAYIMATVKHETNNTFAPVEEAYWLSDEWRRANLRYYPWHGRGHVMLTWEANYQKMSHRLGIPELATNPALAMQWDVSYEILVVGMLEGLFTGRDLDDFINEQYCDYYRARKIVNGMDKAVLIAGYAAEYEDKHLQPTKPQKPEVATPFQPVSNKTACAEVTLKQTNMPVRDVCVDTLQRALNKWAIRNGLPPIHNDGIFGVHTRGRIETFQSAKNIRVDGIVGSVTWKALEPYLGRTAMGAV